MSKYNKKQLEQMSDEELLNLASLEEVTKLHEKKVSRTTPVISDRVVGAPRTTPTQQKTYTPITDGISKESLDCKTITPHPTKPGYTLRRNCKWVTRPTPGKPLKIDDIEFECNGSCEPNPGVVPDLSVFHLNVGISPQLAGYMLVDEGYFVDYADCNGCGYLASSMCNETNENMVSDYIASLNGGTGPDIINLTEMPYTNSLIPGTEFCSSDCQDHWVCQDEYKHLSLADRIVGNTTHDPPDKYEIQCLNYSCIAVKKETLTIVTDMQNPLNLTGNPTTTTAEYLPECYDDNGEQIYEGSSNNLGWLEVVTDNGSTVRIITAHPTQANFDWEGDNCRKAIYRTMFTTLYSPYTIIAGDMNSDPYRINLQNGLYWHKPGATEWLENWLKWSFNEMPWPSGFSETWEDFPCSVDAPNLHINVYDFVVSVSDMEIFAISPYYSDTQVSVELEDENLEIQPAGCGQSDYECGEIVHCQGNYDGDYHSGYPNQWDSSQDSGCYCTFEGMATQIDGCGQCAGGNNAATVCAGPALYQGLPNGCPDDMEFDDICKWYYEYMDYAQWEYCPYATEIPYCSCECQNTKMGCKNTSAVNYCPAATTDDGSCCFDYYYVVIRTDFGESGFNFHIDMHHQNSWPGCWPFMIDNDVVQFGGYVDFKLKVNRDGTVETDCPNCGINAHGFNHVGGTGWYGEMYDAMNTLGVINMFNNIMHGLVLSHKESLMNMGADFVNRFLNTTYHEVVNTFNPEDYNLDPNYVSSMDYWNTLTRNATPGTDFRVHNVPDCWEWDTSAVYDSTQLGNECEPVKTSQKLFIKSTVDYIVRAFSDVDDSNCITHRFPFPDHSSVYCDLGGNQMQKDGRTKPKYSNKELQNMSVEELQRIKNNLKK